MADEEEGKVRQVLGRLKGDPIGRRTPGAIAVEDAFGLAGRAPEAPLRDDGGQVLHVERGFETGRESAEAFYARTAPPPPDPAVQRAEAASVARSAVRQLEAEDVKASERSAAIAARLDAARATVRRIDNGGPL